MHRVRSRSIQPFRLLLDYFGAHFSRRLQALFTCTFLIVHDLPCQTEMQCILFEGKKSDPHELLATQLHALLHHLPCQLVVIYEEAAVGPRAPFGAPFWKPFLNLRGTSLSDRMRPEPVVFLRLAFSPQLSVRELLVIVRAHVESRSRSLSSWLAVGSRTLSNAGAWVSAVGTGVLLDVHGAAACMSHSHQHFSPSRASFSTASFLSNILLTPMPPPLIVISICEGPTYRNVCTERATCCGAWCAVSMASGSCNCRPPTHFPKELVPLVMLAVFVLVAGWNGLSSSRSKRR